MLCLWMFLLGVRLQSIPDIGVQVQSFLQLQNKLSAKDQLLLREYERIKSLNKDMLTVMGMVLNLEYHTLKRKVRRTQSGALCAANFSYNKKSYTDCTQDQSPDGQITFQPWCIENDSDEKVPKWGFCQDTTDYDDVRKRVKYLINKIIPQVLKIKQEQMQLIPQGQKLIENFDKEDQAQSQINNKLQELKNNVDNLQTIYKTLLDFKERWQDLSRKITNLEQELDANPQNCEGIQGYEEDQNGEGLSSAYYENEHFDGDPLIGPNTNIDFRWNGQSPYKNINSENYSVIFQGYLKVPVTSEYQFRLDVDDGGVVFLNDYLIISKNFGGQDNQVYQQLKQQTKYQNYRDRTKRVQSKPIYLIGGLKYSIKIQVYHSGHNSFETNGDTGARLYWKSEFFQEQIIPKIALYVTNKMPPLKISEYYQSQMQLTQLQNYQDAFSDSQSYIIDDVPDQFLNHDFLKFKQNYLEKQITFKISAQASIYVAVDDMKPNPLPADFLDTNYELSVLKVNKSPDSPERKIHAFYSYPYRIYEKVFAAGEVQINLNHRAKNNSFILFYALNTYSQKEPLCGGTEVLLSQPNTESYLSCSASSSHPSNQYACDHGFSGKMLNTPYTTWISNNESIGAYLSLTLSKPYKITKLEYKNLESPSQRAKQLKFDFQNRDIHNIDVKNSDSLTTYLPNPPIMSNTVKMTITEVYSSQNNGGALNVYGIPCEIPKQNLQQMLYLPCEASLQNHQMLKFLNPQDTFFVKCSPCQEGLLFGTNVYSADSSICMALYHAKGQLSAKGVVVNLDKDFIGSVQNGLTSQGRKGGGRGLLFSDEKKENKVFPGMQVDIRDFSLQRWVPGIVQKIDGDKIKVTKEGYGEEFDKLLPWYDPTIVDYCGEKIRDRICHLNSKKLSQEGTQLVDIKICFTPRDNCPKGFLADHGEVFSKKADYEFGWEYNQVSMGRTRGLNQDPILDNFLLFPPDRSSQWCQSQQSISCQPNEWRIKVPIGTYSIKITTGDPQSNFGVGIQANDQYIISPQILRKNQFYTNSKQIVSLDGWIRIKAKCDNDCQNYWSRINAVEIQRVEDQTQKQNQGLDSMETASLGCGNAYQGGRCIQGPSVENCIYEDVTDPGAERCFQSMHLVKIPENYTCVNQRRKYKCIRDTYSKNQDCLITCPGQCRMNTCMVPNFVFS